MEPGLLQFVFFLSSSTCSKPIKLRNKRYAISKLIKNNEIAHALKLQKVYIYKQRLATHQLICR